MKLLHKVDLFEGQDEDTMTALESRLRTHSYKQGDTIVWQGDPGHHLFVVKSGTAAASVISHAGEHVRLSDMGPGDYFGELSLLDEEPRSADVVALTDCELLMLSREDFFALLEERPQLTRALVARLVKRIRHLTDLVQRAGIMGA